MNECVIQQRLDDHHSRLDLAKEVLTGQISASRNQNIAGVAPTLLLQDANTTFLEATRRATICEVAGQVRLAQMPESDEHILD